MGATKVEKAKLKLDEAIRDALKSFTEQTGLEVDKICISRSSIEMHRTGKRDYGVTTWIWMPCSIVPKHERFKNGRVQRLPEGSTSSYQIG